MIVALSCMDSECTTLVGIAAVIGMVLMLVGDKLRYVVLRTRRRKIKHYMFQRRSKWIDDDLEYLVYDQLGRAKYIKK